MISLWAGMSTAKKWQVKHAMQYGMVGFKLYLASLRTRGSGFYAVLSFAFYSHIAASETFPCYIYVCFKCDISVDCVFLQVVGEHSRLVYFTAALVGSPSACILHNIGG